MNEICAKYLKDDSYFLSCEPDYLLSLIKEVGFFTRDHLQTKKRYCDPKRPWKQVKTEILIDWGKWSHDMNKNLRVRIKETDYSPEPDLRILNKKLVATHLYWWAVAHYVETFTPFITFSRKKRFHFLKKMEEIEVYYNNLSKGEENVNLDSKGRQAASGCMPTL